MKAIPSQSVEQFSVGVVRDRDEVVVALTGELDLATADMLEREVRELRHSGCDHIVVDLRQLDFMDSAGLRVLISLRNTAKCVGHRLILVPGPRQVQHIFDLTATRGLFDWRDRDKSAGERGRFDRA